jgi:hypothetical protein
MILELRKEKKKFIAKMNTVESISQIDKKIIKLPKYNSQLMGLGHILPMGIQNDWKNQMVAENYQI